MSQRKAFVGGNWKMNTHRASAEALAANVAASCKNLSASCEIVVFPPFPYLLGVGQQLTNNPGVALGAQDVWHEPDGAYTGEVSTSMLKDAGVSHVLAGQSERRHVIGEDDALIHRKLKASLAAELNVVLCVGELLEQREAGQTEQVVLGQVEAALEGVPADQLTRVIIAYEPVWAIGTGRTASPDDAQAVHSAIRKAVASGYDDATAGALRIVYGGSVKGSNANALFAQPDIDGGLIGGASLDAGEFEAIVRAAAKDTH